MNSRRDVLGALGTAVIASAAGCLSTLADDGNSTELDDELSTESDEKNSTESSFYDWLGPETADTQWIEAPNRDLDSFLSLDVVSPAAAADNEHLEWSADWDEPLELPIEGRQITLDVDPPEYYVHEIMRQFSIYVGSFDADTLSGKFAEATTHDEYRGHEVVTEPAPEREKNVPVETDGVFRGVAFNDRNIVIAHVAPSESRAVEFVHAMLDTEAGAADRTVETNEEFGIVADELGEGWSVELYQVGLDTVTGTRIELDGDTADRRAIAFYETEAEAADSWMLDEDRLESLRESSENDSGFGRDVRTAENMFEPYTDLDSRQEGRYVVLEGTLPTAEIVPIDTRPPTGDPLEN